MEEAASQLDELLTSPDTSRRKSYIKDKLKKLKKKIKIKIRGKEKKRKGKGKKKKEKNEDNIDN
jgi:hypothetical protein